MNEYTPRRMIVDIVQETEDDRRAHARAQTLAPDAQVVPGIPCPFCQASGTMHVPSLDEQDSHRLEVPPEDREAWFRARKFQRIQAAGSRRRLFLKQIIGDADGSSSRAKEFNRGELAFVEAGLEALRFWRDNYERIEKAEALLREIANGESSGRADRIMELLDPR